MIRGEAAPPSSPLLGKCKLRILLRKGVVSDITTRLVVCAGDAGYEPQDDDEGVLGVELPMGPFAAEVRS